MVENSSAHDPRANRDAIVRILRDEEAELRRRGIESVLLVGSVATLKSHPNDVDLIAHFRPDVRPSVLDITETQTYLERRLGRRVDFFTEATFPSKFRQIAEETGIRIFG